MDARRQLLMLRPLSKRERNQAISRAESNKRRNHTWNYGVMLSAGIKYLIISGSFTTGIFDRHVASLFRLCCSNLDLYIITQRCQKAHQSFK